MPGLTQRADRTLLGRRAGKAPHPRGDRSGARRPPFLAEQFRRVGVPAFGLGQNPSGHLGETLLPSVPKEKNSRSAKRGSAERDSNAKRDRNGSAAHGTNGRNRSGADTRTNHQTNYRKITRTDGGKRAEASGRRAIGSDGGTAGTASAGSALDDYARRNRRGNRRHGDWLV